MQNAPLGSVLKTEEPTVPEYTPNDEDASDRKLATDLQGSLTLRRIWMGYND